MREAEISAAKVSPVVAPVMEALAGVSAFAVLTDNSSAAVEAFLRRYPSVARRCALLAGREALDGPKTDFSRFRSGFSQCVGATGPYREDGPIVYVGDSTYELVFARRLGAATIDVATIADGLDPGCRDGNVPRGGVRKDDIP